MRIRPAGAALMTGMPRAAWEVCPRQTVLSTGVSGAEGPWRRASCPLKPWSSLTQLLIQARARP